MIKAVTVCAGFLEITSLPLGLSIQYTGEDFDFAEVVDSAALEGEKNGGFRFRSPSPPLAGGSRESSATAAALGEPLDTKFPDTFFLFLFPLLFYTRWMLAHLFLEFLPFLCVCTESEVFDVSLGQIW